MDDTLFDYPVDGTLDLHMFNPRDARSAVEEYLLQCRIQGVLHVRIIHGKGVGVLSQITRKCLLACPFVKEFRTAGDRSGWGATIAVLDPLESDNEEQTTDKRDNDA